MKELPAWLRYTIACASVLVGALGREALTPALGPTTLPFIFFFPAVAVSAWIGGLGPGILALVLSALAARGFFLHPAGDDSTFAYDFAATTSFVVSASFILGAVEGMQRARRRSKDGKDLLATTLASIGDGVIATDDQGRVTFLNPAAERLTGFASDEAAGKPIGSVFRVVHEETHEPVESPVEQALREAKVVTLPSQNLLVSKDGGELPIDDTAAPIREPGKPITGAVLVFRGVAEQRRAQEARARLAAIVDSSSDAIFTKSLDGIIQTWNAGAERLFGYRADEIVGRSILTLIPAELRHEEPFILSRLRSGLPIERTETVRVTKEGRKRFVSISVSPLKDASGRVTGASKIVHDVTDVVTARRALEQERKVLATTLSSIGDAVIVTDEEGRVRFLNPEAERLTGWRASEAEGRDLPVVFRIVNEQTHEPVENPVEKVLCTGKVVGLANHTILVRKDGSEAPIDDSAAPIGRLDGRLDAEFFGVVLVFRDITERRRAENALREADRRKDEFIAILSHELRNPLAPIRLAVTMLKRIGPPEGEQRDLREIIDRQTRHLGRLLDDLLDVNRITSGKIALRMDRVNLGVAIASAIEASRPLIESTGHELQVDLPETPIHVDADVTRLAQVFVNLLNNAAKYTESGGQVRLTAARENGEAVIRVQDSGIGISADQIPRIFEMFAQVDPSLERSRGGLGVGLTLARRLVEMHGGRIEVRSEGIGKGSEFTVRIPAVGAPVPGRKVAEPIPTRVEPRRVLVVDDNRDAATSLAMLLRLEGHAVQTAQEGREALDLAERIRPDVVFLDIGMPAMNGYEVAKRIRRESWGHSAVLVALTGWGGDEDKRRAREAGFDQHLTKPVELPSLRKLFETSLRRRES